MIAWMRELMEEGLGWEHGVQFVCLAFQNAMAAHINGFTVHHWSGIPARNEEGSGTGDRHKLSMKCQALRVIIIDEVSMLWAELLGTLDKARSDTAPVGGAQRPGHAAGAGPLEKLHPLAAMPALRPHLQVWLGPWRGKSTQERLAIGRGGHFTPRAGKGRMPSCR